MVLSFAMRMAKPGGKEVTRQDQARLRAAFDELLAEVLTSAAAADSNHQPSYRRCLVLAPGLAGELIVVE